MDSKTYFIPNIILAVYRFIQVCVGSLINKNNSESSRIKPNDRLWQKDTF